MFIGSINRYMRAVVEAAAGPWKGLPVYVACSGNFTIERILGRSGLGPIHSNNVSIYSCAVGWHLAGQEVRYAVKPAEAQPLAGGRSGKAKDQPAQDWSWLEPYLAPGLPTIATLLLTGEMLKCTRQTPYHQRMFAQYRLKWAQLHAVTVERVGKALAGVKLDGYFAGDCRAFLAQADRSGVCISFPPTYEGGYEHLYKKLDEIFDWPRPSYELFSPDDFEAFMAQVRTFSHWLSSSDAPHPALENFHLATVQTSLLSKPVYMYGNGHQTKLALARQKVGKNPWPPRTDEVVWPIQVVKIDAARMNAIRSLYLSQKITPADAPRNYAVLSDGKLIGAFSFALPRGPLPCDLYLMTDLAVRPTPHKRLSKLVLAMALSKQVQDDLEQWLCSRIRKIGTTAFTDKPVSMKYRGLFEVYNRGEGRVNYLGDAGKWSMEEGFKWWKDKHLSV